ISQKTGLTPKRQIHLTIPVGFRGGSRSDHWKPTRPLRRPDVLLTGQRQPSRQTPFAAFRGYPLAARSNLFAQRSPSFPSRSPVTAEKPHPASRETALASSVRASKVWSDASCSRLSPFSTPTTLALGRSVKRSSTRTARPTLAVRTLFSSASAAAPRASRF